MADTTNMSADAGPVPPVGTSYTGMRWVAGGSFVMGSEDFYPEERPTCRRGVASFWIDEHPTTTAEFARFVKATDQRHRAPRGRRTLTTIPTPTRAVVRVARVPQSRWAGPTRRLEHGGPRSPAARALTRRARPTLTARAGIRSSMSLTMTRGVRQWAGRTPHRGRVGVRGPGRARGAKFRWGDDNRRTMPDREHLARASFPGRTLLDGFMNLAGDVPPKGYGLYDMVGNVWEWTMDWFTPRHSGAASRVAAHPRVPARGDTHPGGDEPIPRKVIKGGSHLCAPNYCLRYRPAARQARRSTPGQRHRVPLRRRAGPGLAKTAFARR